MAWTAMALFLLAAGLGCSSDSTAAGPNLVTLAGQARSVETTSALAGLATIHLSGPSVLTATIDVTDAAGHHLGTGGVKAVGNDVVVTGPGLTVRGRMRIQPDQVTLNDGASGAVALDLPARSTIAAGTITFQPPSPPASAASTAPATTLPPPPVTLSGPIAVGSGSIEVTGSSLRFTDAPAEMQLASPEADFSWAGSGSITTATTAPLQAAYLGVRAQRLNVSVRRSPAAVDVGGTALALQAFADGLPQLRTSARVDIASAHAATGLLNQKRAFVWTPRNLGSTFDMAILRIRPANAAAAGVHIGLLPMPPMFGGEPHGLTGGDTTGLKGGIAIQSLIARHGDDKRSIGYDAPPGVQMELILEGNFDPITVSVPTY